MLAAPEVPGYEILKPIGKGGMAEVYLARQIDLGRLVAIKFLKPEDDPDPETDLARFRREAMLMAKVSHPHILSLFDFGEVRGRSFLVMEYVEGGDLRRRMTPGHAMSCREVRPVVRHVGDALAYLHKHGIIHRDLKPENILLHEGVTPLVTDFGLAVPGANKGSLTQTGKAVGTLGYVAPEQQYRLKVDARADQYSLAALAYELLTGQLPLGVFKPPAELNPKLSREVDSVILRGLQENPKDRFETVREFTDALDRALEASTPPAASLASRKWIAWSVPLLIAGIAGLVVYAASPRVTRVGPPDGSSAAKHDPAAKSTSAEDQAIEELKRLQAYVIWKARGSPTGAAGEAVREGIWFEATNEVNKDVEKVAYRIWEESGSPKGAQGEAMRPVCWKRAVRRLYRERLGHEFMEKSEVPSVREKDRP